MPLLEADERIAKIVVARRPFDPSQQGWTKMTYRQGDVHDVAALERASQGADVVVHLAFMVTGLASRETIRQINIEGTLDAFRAAGARRFVFASSVAAYGSHRDNPVGMTDDCATLVHRLGEVKQRVPTPYDHAAGADRVPPPR